MMFKFFRKATNAAQSSSEANNLQSNTLLKQLTLSDLPSENTVRWGFVKTKVVVRAVREGLISRDEACKRYTISRGTYKKWEGAVAAFDPASFTNQFTNETVTDIETAVFDSVDAEDDFTNEPSGGLEERIAELRKSISVLHATGQDLERQISKSKVPTPDVTVSIDAQEEECVDCDSYAALVKDQKENLRVSLQDVNARKNELSERLRIAIHALESPEHP